MNARTAGVALALGAIAVAVALGLFLFVRSDRAVRAEQVTMPSSAAASAHRVVEVALANRTLCATGFPVRFCEHQTASARSSAPYVVALAPGASKADAIAAVRACGARVIGPLPPNAFLVETSVFSLGKLSQDAHFSAASEWLPADKIDARLKPLLSSGPDRLDVTLVALAPTDVERLVACVAEKGGARLSGCLNGKNAVTLTLPRALVEELAGRGDVRWLEPFKRPKPLNDLAVEPATMNVRTIWDAHRLTGAGQLVTTSDTGIDTGNLQTMHADLRNNVIGFRVVDADDCYSYDASGHGTHTAGSIVGDGTLSGGQIRGTAYRAHLWAWFCGGKDGYIYTPEECDDLFRPAGATNACIHSASWGVDDSGVYSSQCASMDEYVWKHPDFLPVIANGNAGCDRSGSTIYPMSVGSPATAKNVLSVGAAQSVRTGGDGGWGNGDPTKIAIFSSRGPCADGRIKPDVAAPGVGIASTRAQGLSYVYGIHSNTNYAYDSGTSMATPLTAGAATLVREWLVTRRGFTNAVPTAALVKAVLTGGAKGVTTPDNDFGWGRVDLGESLYPSNRAVRLEDRIPFADRSEQVFSVTLTNAAPFDAQLVWIDCPATAGASKTLVNDLDLIVSNKTTGAVWYGNGVAGGDRTNNVESVRIAEATAGDYAVIVRGSDVTYGSAQGGAAALYLRGAFEGEEECDYEVLQIVSASPSGATVSVEAGTTNDFFVSLEVSSNLTATCAWQLDGVTQPGTTTNFTYGTTLSDHGTHQLVFTVSAEGGRTASRVWTVSVWSEIRIDAATGDDATATGSAEHPYATIAAALADAVSGDTLRVGPGAYAGGLAAPAAVRLESTDGPASTLIDGGGTNRCFDASANTSVVLSGFTLTNGWTDASMDYANGAGAYGGVLTNCVITNCRAEGGYGYGGGAASATLVDCVVENCCGDYCGGGLYGCEAAFCLIRNNGTYYSNAIGGGAAESTLDHCTVFGNSSGESAGGVDCFCVCRNSIVWGNALDSGETSNWESYVYQGKVYVTSFATSCTTPAGYADQGGNTNAAPRWVNADEGDFRLAVKSPCLGTAADGLNMGVWQGEAVPGFVLTATAEGPGAVEPASAFVIEGQSATFTATTHHPFYGWTTNGAFAADAATNVFVWADVRADGTIAAAFGTTNFFVDAESGNDASNGWSWAGAKRTIQAAVDVAGNGERVSVGPGTYGGVEATAPRLDIVGVNGPEVTVIDGGNTNRCYVGYANKATLLAGFTLANGVSTNNYGGGVLYGTLSNCVIRSCVAAYGGGGACDATLTDCVIADCTAGGQGGGAYQSTLVNCTVRGNRAGTWRNDYSWYHGCDLGGGLDCQCVCTNTIVWDNRRLDGTPDNWEWYLYRRGWFPYEVVPNFLWCCTTPANPYGANSITNDPLFASETAWDPNVYEISPCLGAGFGGANIGAYRGTGVVKALPALDVTTATGEEISNAVASVGYVDKAVEKGIGTNGATYAAFAAWSTNGLKSTAVVFSTRAYDSFLVREIVAAPTLLGEGRTTEVALSALEPTSDGTCSTTLQLLDGEDAVPLCSVKAAFARHMNVGDELGALAPADPEAVEAESVNGGLAVRLTIRPPVSSTRYFMYFAIQ